MDTGELKYDKKTKRFIQHFVSVNQFTAMLAMAACLVLTKESICAAKCPCDIYAEGGTPCVAAADLEAGVYTWGGSGKNNNSLLLAYPFVTAMCKNNSNGKTPGPFTLKG
jgi:hypothetical protein